MAAGPQLGALGKQGELGRRRTEEVQAQDGTTWVHQLLTRQVSPIRWLVSPIRWPPIDLQLRWPSHSQAIHWHPAYTLVRVQILVTQTAAVL